MISLVIGILITIVIGAILCWVIDQFCPERRLAQLLQLLRRPDLSGLDRKPPASLLGSPALL